MAYDAALASRVRDLIGARGDIVEKNMMGALCFMAGGHMCCGVTADDLMVRVGKEGQQAALAQPGVRLMEMSGRTVAGFVLVDGALLTDSAKLAEWVRLGVEFAGRLPPKSTTNAKRASRSRRTTR